MPLDISQNPFFAAGESVVEEKGPGVSLYSAETSVKKAANGSPVLPTAANDMAPCINLRLNTSKLIGPFILS